MQINISLQVDGQVEHKFQMHGHVFSFGKGLTETYESDCLSISDSNSTYDV